MYKNKRVRSLGDAAAFSFYPSKNMTVAGDGGIITTNDDEIAEVVNHLEMLEDQRISLMSTNISAILQE